MSSASPQTRRVARNFTWLSVQEVLSRAVALVIAIYLARTLIPADFGALGLALAIVSIVTTLVQAGTGSRATRQTALDPGAVNEIYARLIGFRITVAAVIILVLVVMSPWLAEIFSFSAALLVLCAFLLLRPALTVVWAFRGLDQMHVNAIADVSEKILTLVGIVLLVHGQAQDYLWAPVVEVAAGLLMVVWLHRRLSRAYPGLAIQFRPRDWPAIASEAVPLGLAALLGSVTVHGAVLLLGWLQTAESAAVFLVAQKIMLTLATLVLLINRAAFPSTSRLLAGDTSGALALLADLLRYYLVVVIPACLLAAFHAEALLGLLFGRDYASAAPVLVILLAVIPFQALNRCQEFVLRGIPKPRWLLVSRIVGAVAMLALSAILIPRADMAGAALAVVGGEVAMMAMLLFLVKEAAGGLPLNLRCGGALVAGGLAAVAYWLAGDWPVLLSLPLAAFIYIVVSLLTRAVSMDELRALPDLVMRTVREPAEQKVG